MRDLHPEHGGRVLLEREGPAAAEVIYRVTLYVPDRSWQGRATVVVDEDAVSFEPWDGEDDPPSWLVQAADGFLRSLLRARRRPEAPPWPRRLLRWRAG